MQGAYLVLMKGEVDLLLQTRPGEQSEAATGSAMSRVWLTGTRGPED